MSGFLLDTNHLALAVRRNSDLFSRILQEKKRGSPIGTCVPVLCEVEVGRLQVAHPDAYREGLERVLRKIKIWPLTMETAREYGEIHRDLKSRGRVLSQVDLMLAALARELDMTLVTTDRDFEALPWLRCVSWQ